MFDSANDSNNLLHTFQNHFNESFVHSSDLNETRFHCSSCESVIETFNTKFMPIVNDIVRIANVIDQENDSVHKSLNQTISTVNELIDEFNNSKAQISMITSYLNSQTGFSFNNVPLPSPDQNTANVERGLLLDRNVPICEIDEIRKEIRNLKIKVHQRHQMNERIEELHKEIDHLNQRGNDKKINQEMQYLQKPALFHPTVRGLGVIAF